MYPKQQENVVTAQPRKLAFLNERGLFPAMAESEKPLSKELPANTWKVISTLGFFF